jgi:hypothetical protein
MVTQNRKADPAMTVSEAPGNSILDVTPAVPAVSSATHAKRMQGSPMHQPARDMTWLTSYE